MPTDTDSPIHAVSLALMASLGDDHLASGTATIVAPFLALTAHHVLDDYWQQYHQRSISAGRSGAFSLVAFNLPAGVSTTAESLVFYVDRTWSLPSIDMALLRLRPFTELPSDYRWQLPTLDLIGPTEGDTVTAFGYHSTQAMQATAGIKWHATPASSCGVVRQVHHRRRDSSRLAFPCFMSNARFDGGMSGGPVFNMSGHLCGVICSSLPPGVEEPDAEHASYASILWPSLAIPIDDLYTDSPFTAPYTLFDFASTGRLRTTGLASILAIRDDRGELKELRRSL